MHSTAYNRIAAALRTQILSGERPHGARLPTERELCEDYQTSRITIRRALQILEDEGLVERRQGSGTFVNPNPARKIPLLTSDFTASIESHAPDLRRSVVSWCPAPADPGIAKALHLLPNEDVMVAVRVDTLDGTPVAMDELYLVKAFCSHLTLKQLARMDFLVQWARAQRLEMTHGTQSIEAVYAPENAGKLLGVASDALLLKETNTIYIVGDTPIGTIYSFYRHDFFRFDSTIDLRSQSTVATNYG